MCLLILRVDLNRAPQHLLRIRKFPLRLVDDPQIVVRLSVLGLQLNSLPESRDRIRRPPQTLKVHLAQQAIGFGKLGIELKGAL